MTFILGCVGCALVAFLLLIAVTLLTIEKKIARTAVRTDYEVTRLYKGVD